jgi:ubiquinone/menaquinone biosynthesis C-methylase UbiE
VNRVHNLICSSGWWGNRVRHELIPWGLKDIELGDDVLEVGPGFGATTRVLAEQSNGTRKLNVLELEPHYCERLRRTLGDAAEVTQGDATAMPYDAGRFSAVLAFTMLHHITPQASQDKVFAEAARVLAPGGIFAGTDSIGTGMVFKLIHIGDTLEPMDPGTLPGRLERAGFADVSVDLGGRSMRFRARKP